MQRDANHDPQLRRSHGPPAPAPASECSSPAFADISLVAAGLATFALHSISPDLIVGCGIALVNLDATARELNCAE